MSKVVWAIVAMAAGLVIAIFVHRAQVTTLVPGTTIEAEPPAGEGAAPQPRGTGARGIELTDVYTSDEAEREAVEAGQRQSARVERSAVVERALSAPAPPSFLGLIQGAESSVVAAQASGPPLTEADARQPMAEATQARIESVVEGFFRDALMHQDVGRYVRTLDEDFQYTFDAGTPEEPRDDRVYDLEMYERLVLPELFGGYDQADVLLSEPRAFGQPYEDAAAIVYDYDIRLAGPGDSNRYAGTASLLLVRDPDARGGDEWRIIDWVDSPPNSEDR